MTLTLKGITKNGKIALYTGASHVLRFQVAVFVGAPPQQIEVEPDFKTSTATLTKEERKAARAAAPKPTLQEKIAAREAALAKLKAKAASVVGSTM